MERRQVPQRERAFDPSGVRLGALGSVIPEPERKDGAEEHASGPSREHVGEVVPVRRDAEEPRGDGARRRGAADQPIPVVPLPPTQVARADQAAECRGAGRVSAEEARVVGIAVVAGADVARIDEAGLDVGPLPAGDQFPDVEGTSASPDAGARAVTTARSRPAQVRGNLEALDEAA